MDRCFDGGTGVEADPPLDRSSDNSSWSTSTTGAQSEPSAAEASRRVAILEAELRGLTERLTTQGTIEQAKGMLMAYYGVPADTAFAILMRWSQRSNTKLRDVAAGFVAAASQPTPHPLSSLQDILAAFTAHPSETDPSNQDEADPTRPARPPVAGSHHRESQELTSPNLEPGVPTPPPTGALRPSAPPQPPRGWPQPRLLRPAAGFDATLTTRLRVALTQPSTASTSIRVPTT